MRELWLYMRVVGPIAEAIFEKEWQTAELDADQFLAKFSSILGLETVLDHDKPVFIFSEKVAFDNSLVKCLPKLVEKGIKVKEYRYSRWDVIIGGFITSLVAFFVVVACASTIFVKGIRIETAQDAACCGDLQLFHNPSCSPALQTGHCRGRGVIARTFT